MNKVWILLPIIFLVVLSNVLWLIPCVQKMLIISKRKLKEINLCLRMAIRILFLLKALDLELFSPQYCLCLPFSFVPPICRPSWRVTKVSGLGGDDRLDDPGVNGESTETLCVHSSFSLSWMVKKLTRLGKRFYLLCGGPGSSLQKQSRNRATANSTFSVNHSFGLEGSIFQSGIQANL